MCQFKSGVVMKKKVLHLLDEDGHSEILRHYNIKDDSLSPEFVRVEIVPKELPLHEAVYHLDLKHWEMKLDQDFKPDWWKGSEPWAEKEMLKILKKTVKKRCVLKGQKIEKIKEDKRFIIVDGIVDVSGGTIKHVRGGTIEYVSGGTIEYVSGGTIKDVSGGTIRDVRDYGIVMSRNNGVLNIRTGQEYKKIKHIKDKKKNV